MEDQAEYQSASKEPKQIHVSYDNNILMTSLLMRFLTPLRIDNEKDFLSFVQQGKLPKSVLNAFTSILECYGDIREQEGVLAGLKIAETLDDEDMGETKQYYKELINNKIDECIN